MPLPEEKLVGWLCFWRLQHGSRNDGICCIPGHVWRAWEQRGWITLDVQNPDEYGYLPANITERGKMVTDLNAADWGIESLEAA